MLVVAANAVVARIYGDAQRSPCPWDLKAEVSELLSYPVKDSATGKWIGTSTFFSWDNDTFPAGFTALILKHLRANGIQFQLVRKEAPTPLGPELPEVDGFGHDDSRYAFQMQTVENLLRYRMMVAQVATGGGKSRICNLAVARIKRPALFVTTRKQLMYQMKRHFENGLVHRAANGEPELRGFKIGVIGDSDISPRKYINVAMIQTLAQRLKDPKTRQRTIDFLSRFELVIAEEAHEAGSDSYYEVMKHCKSALYRLALTATPFMKEDREANMRLMACSGPVGITVTEKELIDSGILATPYFKYVKSKRPTDMASVTKWPMCYVKGVVENKTRNAQVVYEAKRFRDHKLPTMILVIRQKHGKELEKLLEAQGVRTRFIWGKSDQVTRDKALSELARGSLDVLIGSNILDVGVDVPAVGAMILAGGYKEEVSLRQRIGRGLRAKKGRANVTFILDFDDTGHRVLKRHSNQRKSIVESTPGFRENVLRDGEDFPFELLMSA